MEPCHKKALTKGLCYLVDNIEVHKVKVCLLSRQIIDDFDAEELEKEKTERDRVTLLVRMLKRRGKDAFSSFIDALSKNNFYDHVIQKLKHFVSEAKGEDGKGKQSCEIEEDSIIHDVHRCSGDASVSSEKDLKFVGPIDYDPNCVISQSDRGTVIYCGSFQGQDVAVKRVVKHVIQREEELLKEMKGKDLPHVLKMLHLEYDEHFAYIVTPLCNFDLKNLIENKQCQMRDDLSPDRRLQLSAQLIEGILNLHDLGIIHRDLKPTNVLIDKYFRVHITDFGTSRCLHFCETTIQTHPAGTIAWMPTENQDPARLSRHKKAGDVQIAGCLVYYILSDGHHPFESRQPFSADYGQLLVNMRKGVFRLDHLKSIANYPSDCVDTLSEMLQGDLNKRPSLLRCLVKFKVAVTSPFETFLAILSIYFTTSLTEELCSLFQMQHSERRDILARRVPGFSFLQNLSQKNVITWDNVDVLGEHLLKLNMVQAVAKVQEYQAQIASCRTDLTLSNSSLLLEDKTELFKTRLRERIQQWYKSMCPIPWKKTSEKCLSEVFTESRLLQKSASSRLIRFLEDKQCQFSYQSFLSDHRLKDSDYIAVEGDPGSGKTILTAQLSSEWSLGKLKDIDIFLPLPLKQVENMTLVEAIKKMWFRNDDSFSKNDIKKIMHNKKCKKCVMLDGVEEYTGGDTQKKSLLALLKFMKVDTDDDDIPLCQVVVTARSGYLNDTPGCTVLRIEEFGAEERWSYIQKAIADKTTQANARDLIENQPVLQHICSVPLLFVLTLHNIKDLSQCFFPGKTLTITQFMTRVMKVFCPSAPEIEYDNSLLTLGKIAFQGLCRKKQKLLWRKEFLERNVANIRHFIDSGILVVEEEYPFTQFSMVSTGNPSHTGSGFESENCTKGAIPAKKRKIALDADFHPCKGAAQSCVSPEIHQEFPSVPLHVRFLHKIIQEWCAADHVASVIARGDEEEIKRHLRVISLTELHYMLRFVCGKCAVNSLPLKHVFDYLMETYLCSMEANDPIILDCLSLCFAETNFNHEIIPYVKRMIDSNPMVIKSEDDGVLKLAKVTLLKTAFDHKLPVPELQLDEVVEGVLDGELLLQNGIRIGKLQTVQKVKVGRWVAGWEDAQQYSELIKYLVQGQSIREIQLYFPSRPPDIHDDKEVVDNIRRYKIKVKWHIGQKCVHIFDDMNGQWELPENDEDLTLRKIPETVVPRKARAS